MASKKPVVDLHAVGARVVSVFMRGKLERVLIEMPGDVAFDMFPDGFGAARRADLIEATERDLADLRTRDRALADSGLAAMVLQLAYEIADPYNSATSKSMCAKALLDAMSQLRELAPPKRKSDRLDDLAARRLQRLAAGGAAS
jgi:hypothetical protein